MKVLFVGDIHGDFGSFNMLINKKKPNIVIQCGDNAYYWVMNDNTGKIKPQGAKVYLIPGNHEMWYRFEDAIGRRGLNPVEVEKNLFYCPIGSSLKVNDANILFIGGADSHDKAYRTIGIDWFPEELLNQDDLDFILNQNKRFDIIVSHTCPGFFDPGVQSAGRIGDPCRHILDIVCEIFNPNYWYFGHWHTYSYGAFGKTKWYGLDYARHGGIWWKVENI